MTHPLRAKQLPLPLHVMAPSAAAPLASVPIDDSTQFDTLFSAAALEAVFEEEFASTTGKGVDRLNGFQFALSAKVLLATASAKCLVGTYRFSPYLEVLKTKGRDKKPRLIGIPTVRDRVVLNQLNNPIPGTCPKKRREQIRARDFYRLDGKVSNGNLDLQH
jgi:RNA-directed DNA polymerase